MSACGSSDGGTCGGPQTCGGDVVGSWKISSSCITYDASAMTEGCTGATVDASKMKISGSVTYSADKTYSQSSTVSGSMNVNYPSSCLKSGEQTITCDALNAILALAALGADSPFGGSSCKASGSSCNCTFNFKDATSQETGTYTTSGASMTETTSDGDVTQETYCVKGGTLTQHIPATSESGISGTIVLTKS